jgi:hypothetical protein
VPDPTYHLNGGFKPTTKRRASTFFHTKHQSDKDGREAPAASSFVALMLV